MRQSRSTPIPRALPKPVAELCAHLEERGIPSFSHGEALLYDLHTGPARRGACRSLLCAGTRQDLLAALPAAVVSAEGAGRLTQATSEGPVDVVPCGEQEPEDVLARYGLAPYAFAFRPRDESWLDPFDRVAGFLAGDLDLAAPAQAAPSPFEVAPRRYWISARLIAEHGLRPSAALIESARAGFEAAAPRLPQAAPARRELTRVLEAPRPGAALAFLRDVGVLDRLVPGTQAVRLERVDQLPRLLPLRWAAWLRGTATASAMVRFRVPRGLARQVERLQASHPLDRTVAPERDGALRRLLSRLDEASLEALFTWRRLEIADWSDRTEAARVEARLVAIEDRIASIRAARQRSGEVRALALDGTAVMERLGAGPGRHVGQALGHLARFVAANPDANEPAALEQELVAWAKANSNLLDATG